MLNSLYHGGYGLAVRSSQTEKAKSFDGNYLEIRYDLASTPFATHTEKSRGKTPVQTSQLGSRIVITVLALTDFYYRHVCRRTWHLCAEGKLRAFDLLWSRCPLSRRWRGQ